MTRNVVLICLDTVRQDYFERFAPRLQNRAGVIFDQCRAVSSCSVPSHASFMTGQLPHQHGIDSYNVEYERLNRSNTFLGDISGYTAMGVSANAFAGSPFGFDEMFDTFTDVSWTRRFPEGMDAEEFAATTSADGLKFYTGFLRTALRHNHTLKTIANAAFAQFDISVSSRLPIPKLLDNGAKAVLRESRRDIKENPEPFFLFINLMDAHVPHQPTMGYDRSLYRAPNTWSSISAIDEWDVRRNGIEPYRQEVSYFRELYGAAIDYLDQHVSTFIDHVQALTKEDTTFVVTADHGENLGFEADDDGLLGHESSLSEALLHVPLAVVNPPEGYPKRVSDYVSQLRLGELITEIAIGETPQITDERIAAERIGTTVPDLGMVDEELEYWERMLRCVYDGDRKIVWDSLGRCTAYELDRERPCWQAERDEPGYSPSWAEEFFEEDIQKYKQSVDGAGGIDVDEHTEARLRNLGYL